MTDVSSERLECEAEVAFRDFDGTWASMQCGRPAVRRMTIRSDAGASYIEAVGGWDSYRAESIAQDGEDPGPDPGRDKWGDDTLLVCDLHAKSYREEEDGDDLYGYIIVTDEEV